MIDDLIGMDLTLVEVKKLLVTDKAEENEKILYNL